jgi:hypothetical protein
MATSTNPRDWKIELALLLRELTEIAKVARASLEQEAEHARKIRERSTR